MKKIKTALISVSDKKNLKPGLEELQELLKDRVQGWVGSTYRAFEPRSRFFKAFQRRRERSGQRL